MTELSAQEQPRRPLAALAVDDSRLADDILSRFDADERRDVTLFADPGNLVLGPSETNAEVVVLSFSVMRMLAKLHAENLAEFCRRHKVVLLIRSQEFLDSTGLLELVCGVVFSDANMHRLKDILALSKAGYSILPSAAVMDIVTDRLRCDSIEKLSPIELAILDQVRLAKTNRAIARGLSLTEANVKTKVRAILKSLKFQNRTEAAVFAARQYETIKAAILQLGSGVADDLTDRETDPPAPTAH
ncbi:MAG TPA: response regulator transcription factor [Rhodospirillaceae bacterium]|nr:response regulator transcription factor [Rhodospirillaceae bacterium]